MIKQHTEKQTSKLLQVLQEIKLTGELPQDFNKTIDQDQIEGDLFFEAIGDNQLLTVKEML